MAFQSRIMVSRISLNKHRYKNNKNIQPGLAFCMPANFSEANIMYGPSGRLPGFGADESADRHRTGNEHENSLYREHDGL